MKLPLASLLGLVFTVSEVGLTIFKRAKAEEARVADSGSLRLLWVVIFLSVFLAYSLAGLTPSLRLRPAPIFSDAGLALFACGLALRWYAIIYLGRFFTVNVAIASDHRLIDTGPYRLIRHPSYTGALMAFVGLGLCLCNGASLAAITILPLLVFMRRMSIEESALTLAFGDAYRVYSRRTKRLIPAVY